MAETKYIQKGINNDYLAAECPFYYAASHCKIDMTYTVFPNALFYFYFQKSGNANNPFRRY